MKWGTYDFTNVPIGTPLTLEKTAPAPGFEAFEEQRLVKKETAFNTGNEPKCTRKLRLETIDVPLTPDTKFEKRQEIAENARNTQQHIIFEIKKNVANRNRRDQWRGRKQKKTESNPGHSALKGSGKTDVPRSQQDVHRNKQEEHREDQKGEASAQCTKHREQFSSGDRWTSSQEA